jgi:hypothetical protein
MRTWSSSRSDSSSRRGRGRRSALVAGRLAVAAAVALAACGPPGPVPQAGAGPARGSPSLYGSPTGPARELGRPGDGRPGAIIPDRGPGVPGAETVPPPPPRDEVTLLGPGDTVHVNVWDHPDLTMTVEIGSDGRFQFPLIGGVRAERLTVAELEAELRRRLADGYVVDPQVTARVESRGKSFYVYGEVTKPGRYPLDREVTVLQAISTAGGPTERGDEGRSTVTRRDGGRTLTRRIGLDEAVRDQDTLYVPISLF